MPIFIDPRTGEKFANVPDEEAERARREFGLVTPEEYALEQRPFSEKAAETLETGVEGTLRGLEQLGSAADAVIPDVLPDPPEAKAGREAARAGLYGPEAAARRQRHPIASAIGEGLPIAAGGAGLGMAGTGVRGALGALALESGASGVSQEAIDATMEKRDFSAKAAAANGLTELAFGALFYGAGRALGGASSVADEAVPGVPGPRNLLDEIDPGTVPPPMRQRPARSVGAAAGSTGDTMSRSDVARYIRDEDEIIDDLQTIAGGGPGERGAFQTFNDAFAESMNNRVKRADFDAAEAAMAPEARAALGAEIDTIADDLESVAATLDARGGKKAAALLRTHINQLGGDGSIAVLDRSKATLDSLHMKAITDVNDPYGEVLGAVDPVANRIRAALENPAYVGKQIAEQQAVRNAAWSDKTTGFIRNMRIANEVGPKLFKKIEVDYHTGQLVMQYDPSGFKALLGLDPHQAKPVLEAWGNILDSAEKMALNTVEVGAESAGRSPLMALQSSISDIRQVLAERARLYAAKDIGRKGIEALGRIESLPGVGGAVRGARAVMGGKNLEAAAGSMGGYVPTKDRSVAAAKALMARRRGQLGGVTFSGHVDNMTATKMAKPETRELLRRAAMASNEDLGRAESLRIAREFLGKQPDSAARKEALEVLAQMPSRKQEHLYRALREKSGPLTDEDWQGIRSLVDRRHGQSGAVSVGDIARSPVGITTGVGAAGLAGHKMLQGEPELPEQRLKREAFEAKAAALPPEDQAAHLSTAETLARVAAQAETRVRGAISELFSGSTRPASGKARAIELRANELDVSRAVVRFMGTRTDDPVEAWKEKRELLSGLVADPARIARTMAKSLGTLPRTEPEIFMKMVAQTMGTVEHLYSLAPGPSGKSALDAEGYPPSLEEITAWAGHWVGSLHPLDTIDDLVANDLVPEQLESVRALHADTFELFQRVALGEIGRMRQSGKRIPMHQLEQIDTALDLNGAGEPVLSWDMARLIQMGEQQAAQTGQQPPQQSPMQSKGAERVASSAMASMRPEAGAIS